MKKTIRILIEASAIPLASTEPPKIAPAHSAQVLETDVVGHMVILLEGEDPDGDMLWYYIVGKSGTLVNSLESISELSLPQVRTVWFKNSVSSHVCAATSLKRDFKLI